MPEKDRRRRAFPPGRRQHRDDALLRAGSACCRRHAVKIGGRFRDTIATMARPNSSTPLVRLVLRSKRSGNSAPRRISTSSRQRRDTGRPELDRRTQSIQGGALVLPDGLAPVRKPRPASATLVRFRRGRFVHHTQHFRPAGFQEAPHQERRQTEKRDVLRRHGNSGADRRADL